MTIHEKYHALAEQSLQSRSVDAEAYLVKVVSEMVMQKEKHKPESLIDTGSNFSLDPGKSVAELSNFLDYIVKLLSETYQDCETMEKKNLCKKTFAKIGKL